MILHTSAGAPHRGALDGGRDAHRSEDRRAPPDLRSAIGQKGVDPGDDGPISRLVGLRSRLLGTVLALLAGVAGVVATFGLTREPEHAFLMMLFALPALGVAVYLAFVWLATVGQLLALVVRTR